jgi:ACS family glucarate transporter-like MFS transporter
VLLLTMVASAGYVARVAITVVAPGIIKDFGLTAAEIGTVFSAFLAGYTLFQLPSGLLADRVGARPIFLLVCVGWALLTMLTATAGWHTLGLAWALPQLWIIRAMFGIVAAPTYPTAGRTLAVAVPPLLLARANSLVLSSVGIGSAVTPILLVPIVSRYGWREALVVPAVLCGMAGLLWWRLAPGDLQVSVSTGEVGGYHAPVASDSSGLAQHPLRLPSFWFLFASYFLQAYLGYIFVFWFFLYLVQVRHFEVLNAAVFTALPWLATIFAIPLGHRGDPMGFDLGPPGDPGRRALCRSRVSGARRPHLQRVRGGGGAHRVHSSCALHRRAVLGDHDPTLGQTERPRRRDDELRRQPWRSDLSDAHAVAG